MKKQIIILILLSVSIALCANSAVATLLNSKGQLSVQRKGKAIKYKSGELLFNADELRTGSESFAAYKYVDGTTSLKMFANSVVEIRGQKEGNKIQKDVKLKKGTLFSQIAPQSGGFKVSTPVAVASVKGTSFFSKVEDSGASTFVVNEGEIDLRSPDGLQVRHVQKGETGVVSPAGEIEVHASTPEDMELIESAELDAELENIIRDLRIPMLDKAGNIKYIKILY